MTAEKCTKKREARAKLLFCQSKPIAFLPFSLPSPSSLKLSSYVQQKSLSDVVEENTLAAVKKKGYQDVNQIPGTLS